jgi:Predicted transcriptional regulator
MGLLVEIRLELRQERIRRRMSQSDVATRLGCSRKRIAEFELGLVSPPFEFVERYVGLLGGCLSFRPPEGDHVDFQQP